MNDKISREKAEEILFKLLLAELPEFNRTYQSASPNVKWCYRYIFKIQFSAIPESFFSHGFDGWLCERLRKAGLIDDDGNLVETRLRNEIQN